MHKNSGFSLIEMMMVTAIFAVLAAIAIPNMINWRSGTNLRGAVENLRGDLQLAKLAAVRENGFVTVLFSDNGYQLFTDDDVANPGVLSTADGERLLRNRELPENISINLGTTDFNGNVYARFNSRGLPENTGKVVVVGSDGDQREIELNRVGRIIY